MGCVACSRCRLDLQATTRPISGHCRTADRKRGPLVSIPDGPTGTRNTVRLRLAAVFSSFLSAAHPLPSLSSLVSYLACLRPSPPVSFSSLILLLQCWIWLSSWFCIEIHSLFVHCAWTTKLLSHLTTTTTTAGSRITTARLGSYLDIDWGFSAI